MDQIGVESGTPFFIEELVSEDRRKEMDGKSVCVTGRLVQHDVDECTAKLTDPQSKKDVHIDTTLIEPFGAKFGSLFQLIGEVDCNQRGSGVIVKVRVVRCVDGMDMALYRKAIMCQRAYLEKRSL